MRVTSLMKKYWTLACVIVGCWTFLALPNNGLRVITVEDHTAPVIAVDTTYNESPRAVGEVRRRRGLDAEGKPVSQGRDNLGMG